MALKSDEQSSHKWLTKVLSSMASLHKNGLDSINLQHKPVLNLLNGSKNSGFYSLEVGNKLPTSPQDLASKRVQYPPILDKNL
jgi:hypothetical protein